MLQIEQEMVLVLDTTEVKTEFIKMWNTVYVPAILCYGRNTQSVLCILSTMDETGKLLYRKVWLTGACAYHSRW